MQGILVFLEAISSKTHLVAHQNVPSMYVLFSSDYPAFCTTLNKISQSWFLNITNYVNKISACFYTHSPLWNILRNKGYRAVIWTFFRHPLPLTCSSNHEFEQKNIYSCCTIDFKNFRPTNIVIFFILLGLISWVHKL